MVSQENFQKKIKIAKKKFLEDDATLFDFLYFESNQF